jgi:transposase-like protein
MGRRRNAAQWELWRRRLREFDRAHQTVAEYCRGLGVSGAAFYQWRRKLTPAAKGGSRKSATVAARTSERRPAADPIHFLPVEISASSQVEVLLPGGARVMIPGRDYDALRTVVAALLAARGENRSC